MKKVLITGSSGLVGTYLTDIFLKKGYKVVGVDLQQPKKFFKADQFVFESIDLAEGTNVQQVFHKYAPDLVVNAFGIKGSPLKAKNQPVDFLYPSFKINTEIINQCYQRDIWLIFMSSVGVYAPAEKFVESDVWKTLPSENDWYPSWSKRTGELLLEAYKIQYGYNKWSIIRPANIFGEYDDFSGNGTVISTMVKKIWESDKIIECWGDGTPTRDFVFGEDVAWAILKMCNEKINDIVNFGSGEEITIKSMVENLISISGKKIDVIWDSTKPNGDLRRQMDITKQKEYDLLPRMSFKEGLKKTYLNYIAPFPVEGLTFTPKDFLKKGFYIGKTEEFIEDKELFHKKINYIISESKTKELYKYRLDYKISERGETYPMLIKGDDIKTREEYIKENNGEIGQRWWEFSPDVIQDNDEYYKQVNFKFTDIKLYFRKQILNYIRKIYPNLNEDNVIHHDNFTLYENGDFIEPHKDGFNKGRYCVVLLYLSYEKDYNDGGGRLIVEDNGYSEDVFPINENFCILDFTQNNPNHRVEPVKNDFRRFTYIDFIYNKEEHETT